VLLLLSALPSTEVDAATGAVVVGELTPRMVLSTLAPIEETLMMVHLEIGIDRLF
jgi:hypothetical protein